MLRGSQFNTIKENEKNIICIPHENTKCVVSELEDGAYQAKIDFVDLDKKNLENVVKGYSEMIQTDSSKLLKQINKDTPFTILFKANSTKIEEAKLGFTNIIKALKSHKVNIKLDLLNDFFYSLNKNSFSENKCALYFNDELFFEYENDNKSGTNLIYKKTGIIDSDSVYCSLMKEEQNLDGNNLSQVKQKLYSEGLTQALLIELLNEAKNYNNRGICFWRNSKEENLDSIIENNIEAYKDFERSHRILKYSFDNSFNNMNTIDEFIAPEILKAYMDLVTKKAYAASTVFESNLEFEAAKRVIDEALDETEKLSLNTKRLVKEFLDTYEEEPSKGYNEDYYNETNYEPWRDDNESTRKIHNNSNIDDNENYTISHDIDSINQLTDALQNELFSYKNDLIKRSARAYLEDPVLKENKHSISEVPVMRRLQYFIKKEEYEKCNSIKKLYDEIVMKSDYLGFKVKGSFMFD